MAGRSVASMGVSIWARTQDFAKGMRKGIAGLLGFQQQAKKTSFATRLFRAQLGSMVRGLAVFAGAAGVFRAFRSVEMFNRAMLQSLAIMSNLTRTLRVDMRAAAFEAARTTIFSATESAKAYFFLASAGLDAAQSIKALPAVTQFAQAGMFNLSEATDLLTDAQSALGLSSKDASKNLLNMKRVGDVLVKGNTLANASVRQFSEALTTKAAASARFAGKEIEETVAVLAAFADQGLKAQKAGTAFAIVLRDLQNTSLRSRKEMHDLGIEVFNTFGVMRNMADIIGDFEVAFKDLTPEMKTAKLLSIGINQKSVDFLKTLIGTSQKIREYEAGLRRAGGTMERVARESVTPLQVAIAKADAAWTKFAETVGTPLVETGASILDSFTKAFAGLKILATADILNQERRTKEGVERVKQAIARRDAANSLKEQERILRKIGTLEREIALDRAIGGAKAFKRVFAFQEAAAALRATLKELRGIGDAISNLPSFEQQLGAPEFIRLTKLGEDIFKRTKTPFEKFQKSAKDLLSVFTIGKLPGGLETFSRQMEKITESFKSTVDQAQRIINVGEGMQIKRSLIEVRNLPASRIVQEVRDPQLQQVIRIGQSIVEFISGKGNVHNVVGALNAVAK